MLWQDTDNLFEEEQNKLNFNTKPFTTIHKQHHENELKASTQLLKYSDPAKNTYRRSLMYIVDTFSNLMNNNNYQEIDEKLLSKDCFIFVMDSDERTSVKYSSKLGESFSTLYTDRRITQRDVMETFIDVEKSTVVQVCKCIMWYNNKDNHDISEGTVKEKISFELFSISDHKISKYRISLANFVTKDGFDPFAKTNKEKMLARVKEINYSLAGVPDLMKFVGLLDEKTEYRVQAWDGQKCFAFNKKDLEENFTQMQKRLKITRIVPFDITANGRGITAAYVYYLEDIEGLNKGKKYLWMSNCAYMFDEDLKINNIIQMGELYSEDEAIITFEVEKADVIKQNIKEFFKNQKPGPEMFYQGMVDFSSWIYRYGPTDLPNIGHCKGLTDQSSPVVSYPQGSFLKLESFTAIDAYIDHYDESYEVITSITNVQYVINKEGHEHNGKRLNGISCTKVYKENGKCSKLLQVIGVISEPAPSPFDDEDFSCELIIPKGKWYGL